VAVEGTAGAGLVDVDWRMSNAWQDASCDDVCSLQDLRCTEYCWPSSALGLEKVLYRSESLDRVCFAVEAGTPHAYHPAKDPENTLCYWNAGSISQLRCPILPTTSPALVADSRLIRRICPCFNSTEAAGKGFDFNCNLGGSPAAPAPATPPEGQESPTTNATSPTSWTPPPAVCEALCVDGFSGSDEDLNGRYLRNEGAGGSLSHWSKAHAPSSSSTGSGGGSLSLTRGSDGRWRFYEVADVGRSIAVAQATLIDQKGFDIPPADTFTTPSHDRSISFRCCNGEGSTMSNSVSNRASGGTSVGVILGIFAVVVAVGCACTGAYCWRRALWGSFGVLLEHAGLVKEALRRAGAGAAASAGGDLEAAASAEPVPTRPEAKEVGQPAWRRALRFIQPAGRDDGSKEPLANYEGPIGPGWTWSSPQPQANAEAQASDALPASVRPQGAQVPLVPPIGSSAKPQLEVGTEVRLQGLVTEPTWNGADGIVDDFDERTKIVQVRLDDGRLKAVLSRNCEVRARRPRERPLEALHKASSTEPRPAAVDAPASAADAPALRSWRSNGTARSGRAGPGGNAGGWRRGDSSGRTDNSAATVNVPWVSKSGSQKGLNPPSLPPFPGSQLNASAAGDARGSTARSQTGSIAGGISRQPSQRSDGTRDHVQHPSGSSARAQSLDAASGWKQAFSDARTCLRAKSIDIARSSQPPAGVDTASTARSQSSGMGSRPLPTGLNAGSSARALSHDSAQSWQRDSLNNGRAATPSQGVDDTPRSAVSNRSGRSWRPQAGINDRPSARAQRNDAAMNSQASPPHVAAMSPAPTQAVPSAQRSRTVDAEGGRRSRCDAGGGIPSTTANRGRSVPRTKPGQHGLNDELAQAQRSVQAQLDMIKARLGATPLS